MKYKPEDWYEWLVFQSRTDHIYGLIHNYLPHDFEPNHPGDFVVVNQQDLPEKLAGNGSHFASESPLPFDLPNAGGFRLLKNNALTSYLEAAKYCEVIDDEECNNYVLLHFTPEPDYETEEEPEETGEADEKEVLRSCWDLVTTGKNREEALQYAIIGEGILDYRQHEMLSSGGEVYELLRVATGYNILAIAYLWNNRPEDAKRCDAHYLFNKVLWPHMDHVLKPYLEMLIAKKQTIYLEEIFSHAGFQNHFKAHYETYISLLVNPHFEWTLMHEIVPIINRVNNGFKAYL